VRARRHRNVGMASWWRGTCARVPKIESGWVAPGLLDCGMTRRRFARGFTLVELLVVVAILGILVAIAIPAFTSRQAKAYDARVMRDAREAANAEEAYFTDNTAYFDGDCLGLPSVNLSPGVHCTASVTSSTSFQITTTHPGASKSCVWISDASPNLTCS